MNRLLTGPASEKETRHLELSLGWSGIQYLPGDSAGVIPENRSEAVEEVLRLTGSTGDEPVTDFYGKALDLRKALTGWLMIGKLSISTVRGWAKLTGNAELRALVSPKNKKNFEDFLWGREFPDLAEQYPVNLEDPQQMFKLLPRLSPRLYSISSSQALYPDTMHLSVRVVQYESYGRKRQGVCSGQLGERTPEGAVLPIFVHSNQLFRLPADMDAPVVMVGPGTGVAVSYTHLDVYKRQAQGLSTVELTNEIFAGNSEFPAGPYGLGMRVPMLVISPWSTGGWVNSQVFDHTCLLYTSRCV